MRGTETKPPPPPFSCGRQGYFFPAEYKHPWSYSAALDRTLQILCFFYRLKVCNNSVLNTIFPTAFLHFMSPCHVLIISAMCQTLSLLLYLLQWSTISDLWRYYCKNITTCCRLRWWLAFFFSRRVFFLIKIHTSFYINIMLLLHIY